MKFLIETHGCKLNLADSQALAREFISAGYAPIEPGETPDVFVLNTCTVTRAADRKARQALSQAGSRFPGARVVATGCYVERQPGVVASLPGVDMAVPNRLKASVVSEATRTSGLRERQGNADAVPLRANLAGRTRAAVKIQEGCDQVCAYCIVPKVRGRERSIPADEIVSSVLDLALGGCPEVVLTGTQLGSYGHELGDVNLAGLVRRILTETPVPRIRVSSLQPLEITGELLDLYAGPGKGRLCPHFHIPLQSGSGEVLRRMRRRYDPVQFIDTVERVRAAAPGCSVTTDIIAGFPGETDADHRATLDLMTEARFADAHVFRYSARPGTSAAYFPDQAPPAVKEERAAEVRALAALHGQEHRTRFVGQARPVLWEKAGRADGLTDNYLRVRAGVPGTVQAGRIEEVMLSRLDGDTLVGEPVR